MKNNTSLRRLEIRKTEKCYVKFFYFLMSSWFCMSLKIRAHCKLDDNFLPLTRFSLILPYYSYWKHRITTWDRLFKSGPSNISEKQPLSRPYHIKFFKGYLPHISLSHSWIICPIYRWVSLHPWRRIIFAISFIKRQSTSKLSNRYFVSFSLRIKLLLMISCLAHVNCRFRIMSACFWLYSARWYFLSISYFFALKMFWI